MSEDDPTTVLVVDDEQGIVDGHAARLRSRYDVRTAYDGETALELLDETVDVVLLDRRMPGLSGDEVLSTLRERDLSCRVAMLTGVEPTFDIVDMGFDDYLCKPVGEQELLDTVARLEQRVRYDEALQHYYALASKVAVLETEHDDETLERRPEYERLRERLTALRDELDDVLAELPRETGYAVATEPGHRANRPAE